MVDTWAWDDTAAWNDAEAWPTHPNATSMSGGGLELDVALSSATPGWTQPMAGGTVVDDVSLTAGPLVALSIIQLDVQVSGQLTPVQPLPISAAALDVQLSAPPPGHVQPLTGAAELDVQASSPGLPLVTHLPSGTCEFDMQLSSTGLALTSPMPVGASLFDVELRSIPPVVLTWLPVGRFEMDFVVYEAKITPLGAGTVLDDVTLTAAKLELSEPLPAGSVDFDVLLTSLLPGPVTATPGALSRTDFDLLITATALPLAPLIPGDRIDQAVVLTGESSGTGPEVDFSGLWHEEKGERTFWNSTTSVQTIWYRWTAPKTALWQLRLASGSTNWTPALQEGAVSTFAQWQDNHAAGMTKYGLLHSVVAGTTYTLVARGYGYHPPDEAVLWSQPPDYIYGSDGSYSQGLDWPPPPTIADPSMSGSPAAAIGWRTDADLAIVFLVTDVWNAVPFTIGYKIPTTLKARAGPFVGASTIAMSRVYTGVYPWKNNRPERWGYLDDIYSQSGPIGCFTMSDWEYATQASTILTVGVDFSGGNAESQLRALSAMSGASLDSSMQGHMIADAYLLSEQALADSIVDVVLLYSNKIKAKSVDLVWAVDNTGSMGGKAQTMKNAASLVTGKLLGMNLDANFAFTTFAEWNIADAAKVKAYYDPDGWGNGFYDEPYTIRFPFGPLTQERQDAFLAASYGGEGGADSPETALEALVRIYTGRAARAPVGKLRNSATAGPVRLQQGAWVTG